MILTTLTDDSVLLHDLIQSPHSISLRTYGVHDLDADLAVCSITLRILLFTSFDLLFDLMGAYDLDDDFAVVHYHAHDLFGF